MTHEEIMNLFNKAKDPKSFVKQWLQSHYIDFNVNEAIVINRPRTTQSDIFRELYGDYLDLVKYYRMLKGNDRSLPTLEKAPKEEFHDAFKQVAYTTAQERFNTIIESIAYDGPVSPDPVEEWVYKTIKNPQPIDVAAYKHFIWQVKRKLLGLKADYQMMINIRGAQGVGKTYSTRKLCGPLKELKSERRLAELIDDRNFYVLAKTYVNIFEELAGASKADIDKLKSLMSDEEKTYRELGFNSHATVLQSCTFISTANVSAAEVFYDPTGMRRFYEVEFTDNKEAVWDYINSVDIIRIWKSVDPHAPYFLKPFESELRVKQESLRQKDSMELFLEENPYVISDDRLALKTIFSDYSDFCKRVNVNALGYPRFKINLTNSLKDVKIENIIGRGLHVNLKKMNVSRQLDKEILG